MEKNKISNRWMVVIGAVLIQLALGAIYAWSVFTKPLQDPNGAYRFTESETQAVFSAGLFVFAFVMIFAGIQMKKVGPRFLAVASALVLGIGYILGGLFGNSFIAQFIFIGIMGGAGIGLGYVVPIAVGVKWFPDKKGLVSGLAVAGFGFGAYIWIKLASTWANLLSIHGVQGVFLIYGVIFTVLVLIGSIWMVNPPEGYMPKGYTPPVPKAEQGKIITNIEHTCQEMLKKYHFYAIWLMFVCGGMAGLMVIGVIVLFGTDRLISSGMDADSAKVAAITAAAWLPIFNGLGRIIWGKVADNVGPKKAKFVMLLLQGILMLTVYNFGTTPMMLIFFACFIGFNFGGNFALFPTSTAEYFGNKSVGANYPFVFTAYGIAGILGPQLAAYVKHSSGVFLHAFIYAGIACLIGAALALTLPKCYR